MKKDKYLIRFFQVGNGTKGGDAILIRLFDESDKEHLVLIDGGYKETGEKIINYIKGNCKTKHIDIVFNTHPDRDHISGLVTLFGDKDITIGSLVLNRPWKDAKFTKAMFDDKRITDKSLIQRLKEAFNQVEELESIASDRKIKISRAFSGAYCYDGTIRVLGPSETLYKRGLLASDKTPQTYIEAGLGDYSPAAYKEEDYDPSKPIEWFDDEQTSAVNQTSFVIVLDLGKKKFLFTGDAGKEALNDALDYYESIGGNPKDFTIVQLPHHGSRKNIDPSIIKRFGNPEYIVSCPPDGESEGHPSRRLINKILEIKPKADIYFTKKVNFVFHENVPVSNCEPQKPATVSEKMDGR